MRRTCPALVLFGLLGALPFSPAVRASGSPGSVTIAGSLQSELGCSGDWDPGCATTHLVYDAADDVWQRVFSVPAGSWEYKAALDDSWNENYGAHAASGGANIPLNLGAAASVKFYYDHKTHWITDNVGSVIAVAPGSFQSELGCPGDWDPGCLRSWLQDPDGDGTYTFKATLPPGNYEAKVALNESWTENYGAGGVQNGPNIPFTVLSGSTPTTFTYDASTHVLTITGGGAPDNNVEPDGLRHDSRNALYRSPGGAAVAGTEVAIRFRTFHNDATAVTQTRVLLVAAGKRGADALARPFAGQDVSLMRERIVRGSGHMLRVDPGTVEADPPEALAARQGRASPRWCLPCG